MEDLGKSLIFFLVSFLPVLIHLSLCAGIVVVLLCLSALISAAESAFFSLTPEEIELCKASEKSTDKDVIFLLNKKKKLLNAILVINNLLNVSIVTIITFCAWTLFDTQKLSGRVVVVLTLLTAGLIVFFGEIIPKTYANKNALKYARRIAAPMYFVYYIVRPFSVLFSYISALIESKVRKKGYSYNLKGLNQALEIAMGSEQQVQQKDMIKGIINLSSLSAKDIMRSRHEITAVEHHVSFKTLLQVVNEKGYSRMPVYKEKLDNISGVLYTKDLLPHLEKEDFAWNGLIRKVYYVPEGKKIDKLLKDFQQRRVHMAILVDEYGGTTGLVTMEDIIEEILGEIRDEADFHEEDQYKKIDARTYAFDGSISLNDFCKVIAVSPSEFEETRGESQSLAGLLLEIKQRLPTQNEKIIYKGYKFIVLSVSNRKIKKVRVHLSESRVAEQTTS